jgi:hypothetical protein
LIYSFRLADFGLVILAHKYPATLFFAVVVFKAVLVVGTVWSSKLIPKYLLGDVLGGAFVFFAVLATPMYRVNCPQNDNESLAPVSGAVAARLSSEDVRIAALESRLSALEHPISSGNSATPSATSPYSSSPSILTTAPVSNGQSNASLGTVD